MKTAVFFLPVFFYGLNVFSQDTLYTKSGQVINARVLEINTTDIKYKKPSNPDGPTYVMNKSDIVLIHYSNGSKDVFSSQVLSTDDNSQANNGANSSTNSSNQPTVINNNYTNGNGYYARPGVNVVIGTGFPLLGYGVWGGGYYGRGYYRGGYYRGGYRNNYNHGSGHHGGGHGHHR